MASQLYVVTTKPRNECQACGASRKKLKTLSNRAVLDLFEAGCVFFKTKESEALSRLLCNTGADDFSVHKVRFLNEKRVFVIIKNLF